MALAVFLVAAAMAVAGGIGVITFREPIRCVLSLVVVMLALSILFLLLSAQFVFVVQIIVYAGAVMVLFLFVIALLGPVRESARGRLRFQPWLSALFALVFLVLIWSMLSGIQYRQPDSTDLNVFGTVQSIAVGLFTTYLYPFELTSILLLVAAIGAAGVLVRRNPLVILICIELMLTAVNLTLITFSRQLPNPEGQLFALMVMTVAAAEAVVGLAILVDIFRARDVEDVDDLSELKG